MSAPPQELPKQFGRYRIESRLGRGGMGTVYLAHDTHLDRRVALKVPHLTKKNPQILERFHREARAAAALKHPNICGVYDVGEIDGIPFLTMDFIEGKPLTAWLKAGKPVPMEQANDWLCKLALALEEAHQRGIVHRDLKPANIMINAQGEPIIMDFGLARRTDKEDARITKSGAVVGTPAYMSPEQINNQEIGPASDIYSLGVLAYELWTGRLPFEADSVMATLGQILTQPPEKPSKFSPHLDQAAEGACLKALEKKPEDRFPTMAAFADALRANLPRTESKATKTSTSPKLKTLVEPAPVKPSTAAAGAEAKKSTPRKKTKKPKRSNRIALAVGGFSLFFLIAIGGYFAIRPTNGGFTLWNPFASTELEGEDEWEWEADTSNATKDFPLAQGQGLKGEYFDGIAFDQFVFTRTDPMLHFRWGLASPDTRIPNDRFSVRWTGWLKAAQPGSH